MLYERKEIALKDGRTAVLRAPERADAAELLDYLRVTAGETEFVTRYPDEVVMTVEQEEDFFEKTNASDTAMMIVCVVDGKLAGNCQIVWVNRRKVRHRASVMITLYREFWNLGIGTMMFREMERVARENGVTQLELEYIEGNERGKALYEKMGFRQYAERPDAYRLKDGTYRNEILMVKKL